MKGRILNFSRRGVAPHDGVAELLPWFVNGSLDGEEQARVERHLCDCARCRDEVEALRRFQTAYAGSEMVPDPASSLRALRLRLDAPGADRRRRTPLRGWRRLHQWARWWTPWAVAVQFAAIVALGVAVLFGGETPRSYRTLSAAAVVVKFDPGTTEAQMRQVVQASGARIVDGPTVADAYVLEVPPEREAAALAALRAQRGVLLAESLSGGAR